MRGAFLLLGAGAAIIVGSLMFVPGRNAWWPGPAWPLLASMVAALLSLLMLLLARPQVRMLSW